MDLELRSTNGVRGPIQTLSDHVTFYLVKRSNKITFAAESRLREDEIKLGRIVYGRSGAKLQAIQPLHVLPGHDLSSSMAIDPRSEAYQLGPASVDQTEIMLLRHGDIITSPSAKDSVACVTPASAVQVNSSATEQVHDETHVNADGDEGIPEDETEDEATPKDTVTEVPVTQTITQPSKSQPSATPNLPKDKSVVIHETPTTDRVVGLHEYEVANANEDHQMAPLLQETVPVTETFSTARTGNSPMHVAKRSSDTECVTERKWPHGSPQVRVNERREKKRRSTSPSSGLEAELSTEGRLVKRARKTTSLDNDRSETHHASPLDGINADLTRTTYSTKRNKRSKVTPDATPTKSFRSSQRSGTATTAAAYEGDLPRVAFSNSAINEKSPSAKFLRKNGGTWLSAVDDKCNVLCVRDGDLSKTMKVFQAIALGIPIVTDKWLYESAKADGFLDLSSYKPTVAQQEKEWGFTLEKVWGIAQTPFKGYSIYFTPTLRKTYTNFREMERVCTTVGAEVISKRASKNENVIVLATEDDPDAKKLMEDGETCYHKDLVTTSILRGEINLDGDEFRIAAGHTAPSRRKGPKKST